MNPRRLALLALLGVLVVNTPAAEPPRPRLQIINGSAQTVDISWLNSATERVPSGTVAPGAHTVITTTTGHRFAVVGRDNRAERIDTSEVLVQAMRFDPPDADGIPAFYTQRVDAGGFPIVASATVNPYAAENILIHEFAHNIHLRGRSNVDPGFDARVKAAYDAAMKAGRWQGKYAGVNHHEYFAEGAEAYFYRNDFYPFVRAELMEHDPALFALLMKVWEAPPHSVPAAQP